MSCSDKTPPTTTICDTDGTRRFWPVTAMLSTRDLRLDEVQVYANLIRTEGTGVSLRFAFRVTNDMNNPGSYTLIGSDITNLGEVVQTLNVLVAATNKLFIQLAISGVSTGAGQAEITTYMQS